MEIKIDKQNMKKVIEDSPNQFVFPLIIENEDKITQKEFKNVLVCGMGGSALPAEILSAYLISRQVPFCLRIHRDYGLPKTLDGNCLIVCISYSGNTEETISAMKEAIKRNLTVIGISSGGEIKKIAKENNSAWIEIPGGLQPRCATGLLFSALIKIFSAIKILDDHSNIFLKLSAFLKKDNLEYQKLGKSIARRLINKVPLIYASNQYKYLAKIWKIKFNENSKIPAFWNYFPELNHNEMVGFTNPKNANFYGLILESQDDHPRNIKRMNLFAKLLKKQGIKSEFISIKKSSFLPKIFSTILLGDWTSYYLALEYKVDPTPVEMVEMFKKQMKN